MKSLIKSLAQWFSGLLGPEKTTTWYFEQYNKDSRITDKEKIMWLGGQLVWIIAKQHIYPKINNIIYSYAVNICHYKASNTENIIENRIMIKNKCGRDSIHYYLITIILLLNLVINNYNDLFNHTMKEMNCNTRQNAFSDIIRILVRMKTLYRLNEIKNELKQLIKKASS